MFPVPWRGGYGPYTPLEIIDCFIFTGHMFVDMYRRGCEFDILSQKVTKKFKGMVYRKSILKSDQLLFNSQGLKIWHNDVVATILDYL